MGNSRLHEDIIVAIYKGMVRKKSTLQKRLPNVDVVTLILPAGTSFRSSHTQKKSVGKKTFPPQKK